MYLEAPLITEEATDLLKNMCGDETRAPVGLHLLQDLVIRRPPKQLTFLNGLLLHTAHENPEVKYFMSLLVITCLNSLLWSVKYRVYVASNDRWYNEGYDAND